MHVDPAQIERSLRQLDSATLRGKLAVGDLTDEARALAEAILAQREQAGAPDPAVAAPREPDPTVELMADFARRPLGWPWGAWIACTLVALPFVAAFGTQARQPADQGFLYGVIALQALTVAAILRTIHAIFASQLSLGLLGKLLAIGLLLFVLTGLTVCSMFAQSGWGGR